MKTIRFLLSQLGPFTLMFWLLLLAGALDGIAGFSVPILLAEFTRDNTVHTSQLTHQVLPLIAACLIATLTFQWCLRRWGEALHGWLANDLRARLFRDVEALSVHYLSQHHSGYLASLVNQVASSIGALATTILWLFGHLVTTLSLFFIFTARESVVLAWANAALLTLFVAVSVMLSRRIVPFADAANTTSANAAERFIDFLTHITTVKKLGIASWAERKIRYDSRAHNEAIAALQRFHANRWAVLHSIFFTCLLTTIAVLVSRIEAGMVSASVLILFIAGFSTVRSHTERLSELIKSLLESDAYVDRLTSIISQHTAIGVSDVPPFQEITLRNISFSHRESAHQIHIPELVIRKGDRILITGRSGQGKSTLLSLVARQLTPSTGECLWNQVPYHQYNASLTASFALASQEAELFNLSLRDNLSMGREFTDDEIIHLLEELGLQDLLASMPYSLDTKVGERGLRLSAGQKQRINLARAILLRRPIILLDEPTAHLDDASERQILHALERFDRATTILIVSHEPIFRSFCNREYYFQDGVLRE